MRKRQPKNTNSHEGGAKSIRLYKSRPEKMLSGRDDDYAEQQWEAFFATHKEQFTRMAADALAAQSEGLTEDLDPENL